MGIELDFATFFTGTLIFLARVIDVALGTLRTISIVHGRTKAAFLLGFVEISLWLAVITTVVTKVMDTPVLGVFYALGFATGNVVGILLERRMAGGPIVLRVILPRNGRGLAEKIRAAGYPVTTFAGEDESGPVTEAYVFCRRRDLKGLVSQIRGLEPEAFYITEQAGRVNKITRPTLQRPTDWRAIFKKK